MEKAMEVEVKVKKNRKANGHGYTYKIKGGNSYRTVIRVNGHIVTGTAKTQQESRRKAKEKVQELPFAARSKSLRRETITLKSFLSNWLEHEHKAEIEATTWRRYESLARTWIYPALGEIQLRLLTRSEIKKFLSNMKAAGQSPRSQQQARALLCVAFNSAVEHGLIATNPAREVSQIPLEKKPITPLTEEEVRKLLAQAKGTYMEARLHIAVIGGLRQGEALGLRWSNLNENTGMLTIDKQIQKIDGDHVFVDLKTSASVRSIALPSETRLALAKHRVIIEEMKSAAGKDWSENDLIFPNSTGNPLDSKVDYKRWHAALDAASITRRSLHNARHTAGTLLYANNVGIETIRRILGHSSVLITSNTYVHNAVKPLQDAARTIDSFLTQNEAK
jgi:integrase